MPRALSDDRIQYITKKTYALFALYGFDGISMDKVAAYVGISKVTLYRYCTSKKEIVCGMVKYMKSHLDAVTFNDAKCIEDVIDVTQEFYCKSAFVAAMSGSEFLLELESRYPDLYVAYIASTNDIQKRFNQFYKKASDNGFLRKLFLPFVTKGFTDMLSCVLDAERPRKYNIELSRAISEHYRIFLSQILAAKYSRIIEKDEVYEFSQTLAKILQNEFFIDE